MNKLCRKMRRLPRDERIAALLKAITGQDRGNSPQAWWDWWRSETEVSEQRTRAHVTYHRTMTVSLNNISPLSDLQMIPESFGSSSEFQSERVQQRYECFVAGTPVCTQRGEVAIEKIRTGDLVLTQNLKCGEFEFKPVVRPTTRPAMALVQVRIGSDNFTCTGGHLFWVLEQGWVKARNLKPGMAVHGAEGTGIVLACDTGTYAPTHNLVVADNHNYFVGDGRLLTHDNSSQQSTNLVAPGLPRDVE